MNKTERLLYQKHILSDEERNQCLRLINCGLDTREIAGIMHVSTSTVSYIRQAHTACLAKDWSTLQKLSTSPAAASARWAMKVTGVDKLFEETFKKPEEPKEVFEVAEEGKVADTLPITRDDILAMYGTLQDIRSLLVEIRDMLK
jgi:hypothetical protein